MTYVIGVDVGTQSARAGVFDAQGRMLGSARQGLRIHHPQAGWAEQSSADIWGAICASVRGAMAQAGVDPARVTGIGFDATCSLVLTDAQGAPLPLSGDWDVILWMDQRATEQAARANATGARPLAYVGGTMSPEMEMPKLMWLKAHRHDLWARMGAAFDLADWLTWKASGSNERSACTLTCKWGYLPDQTPAWDGDFLAAIDLTDLQARTKVPDRAVDIGTDLGPLTAKAAADLGLPTAVRVAAGIIDAHAGALAVLGAAPAPDTLALIAGTSNCHMALHPQAQAVPGVWGPYLGAVLPGLWLNEGGQTATGAALDHLVASHAGAAAFGPDVHGRVQAAILDRMADGDPAPDLHVLPDFLGNRSPHADPDRRAIIAGLTFDDPPEQFLRLYWATATGIAHGTRAIIDRLNAADYAITRLILCGGHAKSPLLARLYADATGCTVLIPDADEPVLLGAAVTALMAVGGAQAALAGIRDQIAPDPAWQAIHARRWAAYQRLDRLAGELAG
ncbi:FGGY-family carbohydrate kinase [Paracoccus sp. p4-l81]|uniref:FGGY-family carbohydrate kinase n=1 Tax=unclassified Paracoccus (in: a-proteobacteria) TaxID=2688777 RepID=UPI0035B99CB3